MTPNLVLEQALAAANLSMARLACRAGATVSEHHLARTLERALQAPDARPLFPLLRELVELGADPAKPALEGRSCLDMAKQSNRLDCYWVLASAVGPRFA